MEKQGTHASKCEMQTVTEDQWGQLHPEIIQAAYQLYLAECYAQAVEAAFAAINQRALEMGVKLRAAGQIFEGVSAAELAARWFHTGNGRNTGGADAEDGRKKIKNFAFRQLQFVSELMTKLDEVDQ